MMKITRRRVNAMTPEGGAAMMPELGNFLLCLAAGLAPALSVHPCGARRGRIGS